jgi:hypothetical protein
MTKKKTLFSIKNKQNKINMDVDESLYNHFQTLTPLQQKAVQDLMTLKLLQQITNKLYYYQWIII